VLNLLAGNGLVDVAARFSQDVFADAYKLCLRRPEEKRRFEGHVFSWLKAPLF
jgi:hypothetical protein